jgi:hypothetical protein
LFTHCHCFSCSMSGLNCVQLICMGTSFDVDVDGNDIVGAIFLGTICDSQCFSCRRSKSLLLQRTTWTIAWLNVDEFDMVNNRSFTSLHSPYWNWFMSVISSHDMSQANCLKFDAYIVFRCGPWWRACN